MPYLRYWHCRGVAWPSEPKRRIEIIESPTETCDQPDTLLSERGTTLVWSLLRYSTLLLLLTSPLLLPPLPRPLLPSPSPFSPNGNHRPLTTTPWILFRTCSSATARSSILRPNHLGGR